MPSDESKGSQLDAIGSLAQRQLDNTLEDVREAVEFGFRPMATTVSRNRLDLGVLVRQLDVYHRLLLDPVLCQNSAQPASTKELRLSKSG